MESLRLFSGGGNAVRFSDFCFWSGFAASFAKFAEGRVSPKIFASELLVSGVCVQSLCFLVLFCLCFCFIVLEHFPESFLKKFSSCQVRVLQNIFGSELLVLAFCVRSVFFGGVSPMFLLYCAGTFSRKLPEKILFLSGARFAKNFRERTFGFGLLCPVGVFWWCFAYVFALLCWNILPKVA